MFSSKTDLWATPQDFYDNRNHTMKRELTLADIAGYLPYDLKVQDRDQDIWVLCQLGNADPCMDGDIGLTTDDGGHLQYDYLDDILPVLRPMSDLYVEITERGYNEGKPFVTILEIGKLSGYDCIKKYETEGMTEYSFECRNADDVQGYVFGWCQTTQSFGVWYDHIDDEIPSVESMIMNTDIFDLFHRLHFDYRGLIPAGLAVSVHDLKQNPYE